MRLSACPAATTTRRRANATSTASCSDGRTSSSLDDVTNRPRGQRMRAYHSCASSSMANCLATAGLRSSAAAHTRSCADTGGARSVSTSLRVATTRSDCGECRGDDASATPTTVRQSRENACGRAPAQRSAQCVRKRKCDSGTNNALERLSADDTDHSRAIIHYSARARARGCQRAMSQRGFGTRNARRAYAKTI